MSTNTIRSRCGGRFESSGVSSLSWLWLGLVGLLVSFGAACSGTDGSGGPGKCAGVSCEYGVCNPESGECTNPSTCGGGSADAGSANSCLPGFQCQGGTCQPRYGSCQSDDDCAGSASCEKGACVNPDSCENSSDCLGDSVCADPNPDDNIDEKTCQPNPCKNKTCDRGVCDRRTGECGNPETCSENGDCRENFACYDGSCASEDTVCSEGNVECDRGVCDYKQKKCVNADTCEEDADCLEGRYCDGGTCKENKCDQQMKTCDRGVCEASTAECVNAESCDATSDCLSNHLCVSNTCEKRSEACSDCTGNQECEYDEGNLETTCKENSNGCRNALDCLDNRVCRGGSCQDPGSCESDEFEPNNSASEGTAYLDEASAGSVSASVCPNDTDVFLYNRNEDEVLSGEMVVDLAYESEDVGIGALRVELQKPKTGGSGYETVASGTAGDSNNEAGRVHLETDVGVSTRGDTYRIRVTSPDSLSEPGVRYELRAHVIDTSIVEACNQASQFTTPVQQGNTNDGRSAKMGASCVPGADQATEQLYTFTLQKQSFVTIDVEPTGENKDQIDLAASIRSVCKSGGSELACANDVQTGSSENIARTMEPGTYYLVVQGTGADTGGTYSVTFNREDVVCTSADNTCEDQNTAKICNSDGTKLETVQCDNGCNQSEGVCRRPETDVCRTAGSISGDLQDATINWDDLQNTLDPGSSSCINKQNPETNGPDAIYKLTLESGHALSATLDLNTGQKGSLYLLQGSCGNAASTCIKGVDGSEATETLTYENQTGSSETLYLVADSKKGTSGQATLDVSSGEVVCQQGDTKCQSGNVVACNSVGTGFEPAQQCSQGCQNKSCVGDTCNAPIQAGTIQTGNQKTWTLDSSNFQNDYTLGNDSCTDDEMEAGDAVFEVEMPSSQVVFTAEVTPQNSTDDPAIYMVETCGSTSQQSSSCLAGNDDNFGGESDSITVNPDGTGPYYVVVDGDDTTQIGGQWDVSMQVESQTCQPGQGTCQGQNNDTAKVCNDQGTGYDNFSCSLGCNSGACRAERCSDPLQVPPNQSSWTKTIDMSTFENNYEIPNSACAGDNLEAPDAVFEIQAQANDWITAEATPQNSNDDPALYLVETCGSTQDHVNSCLSGSDDNFGGDPESLSTQVSNQGTYYLVVDGDDVNEAGGKWDISVDVQAPKCQPNTGSCQGQNTARVCNSKGLKYNTYDCSPRSCVNGACRAESCAAPFQMPANQSTWTKTLDMSTYRNVYELGSNSCVGDDMPGPDAVVEVQAESNDWIYANVEPQQSGDDPAVYVVGNCGDTQAHANSCLVGSDDNFTGGSETAAKAVPSAGTYYVVVDGDDVDQAKGKWDLEIKVQPQQCSPNAKSCVGSNKISVCGPNGLNQPTRTCAGSCQNGSCTGDTCSSPASVGSGIEQRIDMSLYSADYDLGSNACADEDLPARDVVYQVNVDKGDWIRANVDPLNGSDDPAVYITGTCGSSSNQASSCKAATKNNNFAGETEQISWQATSAGTYFVVVDGDDTDEDDGIWEIDIDKITPQCQPGQGQTSCPDQTTREYCNKFGQLAQETCQVGCRSGFCEGESCMAPIQAGNGGQWTIDTSAQSNDYQLPSSSCVGDELPGADTVFAVQMQSQQTLTATVTSQNSNDDPAIYVTSKCGSNTQSHTNNCVVGADENFAEKNSSETVQFATPQGQGGTYYVVIDGDDTDEVSGKWKVDIGVQSFACTAGNTRCKSSASGKLEYCSSFGQYKTYDCSGACDQNTGRCKNPTADRCIDAIPLQSGQSFQGRFSDFNNTFEPRPGTCTFRDADAADGPDAMFSVDLQQGELLTADLETSESDAGVFLLDGCPASGSRCVQRRTYSNQLQYRANQAGTYYVVVDSSDSGASASFTLDVSTQSNKTCVPERTVCSQQGNLDVCNPNGTGFRSTPYACTNGCSGEFCNPPSQTTGTCSNAYQVQGGGLRMVEDWNRYQDDYDPGGSNYCVDDTDGREAVYEVTLAPGQYVEASIDPINSGDDPTLYFVTSCQNIGSSCLGGTEDLNSPVENGYYNDTGSQQTVYVVADSDDTDNDDQFIIDIEVDTAECDPTKQPKPARCADSQTTEICNSYGVYEPKTCFQGCNSQTGRCTQPTNDQCGNATTIQRSAQTQTFRGRHQNFTDQYNAKPSSGSSCTGSETAGPDAVYSVDLAQGDILEAEMTSLDDDAALWVTSDCAQAAQSCVVGEDSGDPESITFQASQSGTNTYYVMADVDASSASGITGEFRLDVTYAGPAQCQPGSNQPSCNGNNLQYCTSPGLYSEFKCSKSCQTSGGSASCANPTGEVCADAISITSGSSDTRSYGSRARLNPGDRQVGNCNFTGALDEPSGAERIYSVDLKQGETVTAQFTQQSGSLGYGVLYLLQSCGDPTTCQANTQFSNTNGQSGQVQYTASQNETVYVVMDTWASSTNNYKLDVTVQ